VDIDTDAAETHTRMQIQT